MSEIEDRLNAIRAYINKAGHKNFARIVNGRVHPKTIKNWSDKPELLQKGGRKGDLEEIYRAVVREDPDEKFSIYKALLAEMNEKAGSQEALSSYCGRYIVYHNFESEKLVFNNIIIASSGIGNFPLFAFPINIPDLARPKGFSKTRCDGFVFMKGDYILMCGLSEYVNAFAVFSRVVNVKKDILRGKITINDASNNMTYSSSAILKSVSYAGDLGSGPEGDERIRSLLNGFNETL